jgi:hypothetical protein
VILPQESAVVTKTGSKRKDGFSYFFLGAFAVLVFSEDDSFVVIGEPASSGRPVRHVVPGRRLPTVKRRGGDASNLWGNPAPTALPRELPKMSPQ